MVNYELLVKNVNKIKKRFLKLIYIYYKNKNYNMKYLKTFESFSPLNEEEGVFGNIKKKLLGDVIENNLHFYRKDD